MQSFNTADKAVHQALFRMKSPEMLPLLKFFENALEESKVALIRAEGAQVAKLQGRAGLLQEIVLAVKESASVLEKLDK